MLVCVCVIMCVCVYVCACMRGCHSPGHLVDDGGEVGGSVELDTAQALEVGLQHTLDGHAVGVIHVGVLHQTEGMVRAPLKVCTLEAASVLPVSPE